jgi:hypothetical protein
LEGYAKQDDAPPSASCQREKAAEVEVGHTEAATCMASLRQFAIFGAITFDGRLVQRGASPMGFETVFPT